MDPNRLRELLQKVAGGALGVDEALTSLRDLPFTDLGFARVDQHRALRQGAPEVVLGEPKTAEQIVTIAREIHRAGQSVMITRIGPEKAAEVRAALPFLTYNPVARIASHLASTPPERKGRVLVVTAGTGDVPVAEEAAETLRLVGARPTCLYDVGVAGLHRLLAHLPALHEANVIVAVAGMEGALPSVVGGLVRCPVIAVPTSVGYGAHLGGMAPLFTMLTTCAAGVLVTNIDNGFGAAMAAHRILTNLD
ncbi:MAG TPA: nickel pincer cofactor biosynthesis protein LarB [Polyangiaceae bacterium]|nr:nickel pincer cofactor biosynthesis protein LarB [Polyangiaceae bacterium]